LKVSQGVCTAINAAAGNTGTTHADLGLAVDSGADIRVAFPPGLHGNRVGCVDNTSRGHAYYFYQVLGVP
jgi:hypothetical protein